VTESQKTVKLCDFTSSCHVANARKDPLLVSLPYRAPEIMLGLTCDYGIDMWSVAVTLYEIYTGKVMFPGETPNRMLKLMMDLHGKLHNEVIRRATLKDKHFNQDCAFLYSDHGNTILPNHTIAYDTLTPTRNLLLELWGDETMNQEGYKQLEKFRSFLGQMTVLDPLKRITCSDALKHPFIDE